MSVLRIRGGKRLDGKVRVHGAKNSVLPILAATLLVRGESIVHNCPKLSDVAAAIRILEHLGCQVRREGSSVIVNSAALTRCDIPHSLMQEMRSSVIFLGAVLARAGEAVLSSPGGCELGPRPIDLHLSAMRALGAHVTEEGGNIVTQASKLSGCRINLRVPSVGATENAMLAGTACEGQTTITNAACEPEIRDLQEYLCRAGFHVSGAGTPTITIEGSHLTSGCEHTIIPDRIVAATLLSAVAAAGGRAELQNVNPGDLLSVTDAIEEMGCTIKKSQKTLYISTPPEKKAISPIVTRPYPGFPTDAQPPLMAASLMCSGATVFIENIFENRYRHASELRRMGAEITLDGKVAIVRGGKPLIGTTVMSSDLRGGAALCVAAVGASGVTEVSGVHHIDRGYDSIETMFLELGADIQRTNTR